MQYQSNIRARSRIHFAVEKQEYYILRLYVCSLRYPARKWHAPYCHQWHVRLYNTTFYLQFSSVTVLIPKRNEVPLYMYIGFHEKHPLFL